MASFTRRKFVKAAAAAGAASLAAGAGWWWWTRSAGHGNVHGVQPGAPAAVRPDAFVNPLRLPGREGALGILPLSSPLQLDAAVIRHELMPGESAPLWAYVAANGGAQYVNPLFIARTGDTVEVTLRNALPERTIIHWHGFHVDEKNDGGPMYAVGEGGSYRYRYQIANRGGMYWYHPHPHHITGSQVHAGLAGLFIVEDADELALRKALDLQLGATDLPLVIQDKRMDSEGRLAYAPTDEEWQAGFLGNEVLVNLTPRPYLEVAPRHYRLRILNGSTARIFRLAFLRGDQPLEFHVIGTDGGLLDRPYPAHEAFLSPSERLDLLLDFRRAQAGDAIMLKSLAFDPMHQEGGPGTDPHAAHGPAAHAAVAGGIADGAEISLLKILVGRERRADSPPVPEVLSRISPVDTARAGTRPFTLDIADRRWRINGLTYDISATPVTVKRGSTEIWEIRNVERSMPHPMHVHGFPFQVLERRGSPRQQAARAVNPAGLAVSDLGWKDTVLAWPGETVRIALDFTHSFEGEQVYTFHCHNLEHEDRGMMINFRVA